MWQGSLITCSVLDYYCGAFPNECPSPPAIDDSRYSCSGLSGFSYVEPELFTVEGDCRVEGHCISSLSYPEDYGNDEHCTINIGIDSVAYPKDQFDLERYIDTVVINEESILEIESGQVFELEAGSVIEWNTDSYR